MNYLTASFFYSGAAVLLLVGCGGDVDIGHSSVQFAAPDPEPQDSATDPPGTTNVLKFEYSLMGYLGADDDNLYVEAYGEQVATCKIERCSKSDCFATLTPIHEFAADYYSARGFALHDGYLGWVDPNVGFEICSVPDCIDLQSVPGIQTMGLSTTLTPTPASGTTHQ